MARDVLDHPAAVLHDYIENLCHPLSQSTPNGIHATLCFYSGVFMLRYIKLSINHGEDY